MKIGIDAHAAEREGSGNCTYIQNLLKSLIQIDDRNEYILYATRKHHPFYQIFKPYQNQVLIKEPPFPALKNPVLRIPLWLARETYKDSLDVLHVQYIAPPFHKGALVATIHDLGFIHVPETFSRWEVFRSKLLVRMTAKKSKTIITGSQFTRQNILQAYCLPSDKVEAVPLGVSPSTSAPQKTAKKPLEAQKTLRKYKIQNPYILTVGRLNPRKNLVTLVKAFSLLKQEKQIPHQLVIAGKHDFNTRKVIQSIQNTPASPNILFTGLVSNQELWNLYKEADVFIYPSLFEGVGLPVLEAMSAGVPVITSNSSSLQETAGDAAILVNPLDPHEISQALDRLISSQNLRQAYAEKGTSRAKKFSWHSTAEQTLKVYEKAVKS